MAPPALSAFEARRRANVAQNQKLLKEAAEAGSKLSLATQAPRPATRPAARKRKREAETVVKREIPTRITRSSARLSTTGDAELVSLKSEVKDVPSPAKRRRQGGDLDLTKLVVDGRRWTGDALASFARGAQPGVRTFTDTDVKATSDKKLKSLRKDLSELAIYDGWQPNDIKLTPERIYALAFHPIREKAIILGGDKKGVLGVFDASQEKPDYDDEDSDIPLPRVSAIGLHAKTITAIIAPQHEPNSVITASYDSSIRCVDLFSQVSTELWAPSDDTDDPGISCADMSAEQKDTIIFSTLEGSLGRLDRRSKKADIWSLAENKIGGFSLHPLLPYLVATASLDRTLKIWDLRMIKGKGASSHPSLLGEHPSRLSVSHASWSRHGYLATSSYDDTIKIYDMTTATKWKAGHSVDMEPARVVRHNNQTGRWVTIFKPRWQTNPSDGVEKFAIGNMNRFVDIYDSNGTQLAQLEDAGITAVPAVAQLHPSQNWVAGGTASGKLCLWM